MAGILFLELTWGCWIYSTFIMEKTNPFRFPLSAGLLITIILSVYKIHFLGLEIYLSALFLLIVAYTLFMNIKMWNLLYAAIGNIILTSMVASFLLLSLYDPVWLFIEQRKLLSILVTFLSIFLFNNYRSRIASAIIGLIQGEFLYALILKKFSIHYLVASLSFMDILALTCMFISIWSIFENLQSVFEYKKFHEKKEKQLLNE